MLPRRPCPMPSSLRTATVHEHRLSLAEVLDLLTTDRMVAQADADSLRLAQGIRPSDAHPLIIIAGQKWASRLPPHRVLGLEELTEWLAGKVELAYYRIDPLKIDFAAVTAVMSSAYATRFGVLPVQVGLREVVVATTQPYLREWEKEVAGYLKKDIRRVVANPADVARYLVEFYNLARSVKNAARSSGHTGASLSSFEQLVELGQGNRQFDANDSHIVNIVDWLWQYAFEQRASDIHIEPRRDMGLVRFRIDGILHQVYQMPMPVLTAMTSRIKILGRMDVVEKRRPQDGRIKTRVSSGKEVELRLSTLPTAFGEKLVMRIFDPEVLVRNMAELGFSEQDEARWHSISEKPHGIVLVTGPTGSGKTTTLYSTLKQLATPEVNVCTIEDPIEMVEPAFNQMQVHQAIELGFADGVRALMRQDPDIIMVGEIRDLETAEMAIQAALTGHLVLSTLHTNTAAGAVIRLQDMGLERYLITSSVNGVLAQRLVRRLCTACKVPVVLDDTVLARTGLQRFMKPDSQVFNPVGCPACRQTGYSGRTGIHELFVLGESMHQAIISGADATALHETARKSGMFTLYEDGLRKVAAGETSLEEVLRVTQDQGNA